MTGVLALAALLRMGWPGINEFNFDQARVSLLALQMARQGEVPVLGIQSSSSIPNFPTTAWLFALPYRLSSDPLVATLFVGLLGTLAVAGVWWLARRAWGPWAALSAALLFAASPFAVLYSRAIWSQDLLPPLAVAWAIAGVAGVSRQKSWAIALHIFLAGLGFQVHYAGVALIPASAWLIIRYRLWNHWRAMLIGAAAAVLAAWPFVSTIACCAPTVQADLQQFLQQPAQTDLTAPRQIVEMGIGTHWEFLLVGRGWQWEPEVLIGMGISSLVLAVFVGLGLLTLAWQALSDARRGQRDWRSALTALLPVWALSAALVFLSHKTSLRPQYQLAALPALFLAAGAVAGLVRRRPWNVAITLVALAIALTQSAVLARGFAIVGQQATPSGIDTLLVSSRAVAYSLMDGRRIAVHTQGDVPEFFGDAAAFDVLLWDYPHQIVDGRSVLLVPGVDQPGGSVYLVFTYPALKAWSEAQASGLKGQVRMMPRREGEPPYVVLTVEDVNPAGFQPVEPLTLANGAQLRGWRARQVGDRLRFTTWWKVAGPVVAGDYHQFHHLRSEQNPEPIAIRDVVTGSHSWQVGDTLIVWADFDRPVEPGPFYMDVGMYTWPDLQRSPVLDRPGDSLAPIRLGPFVYPVES